MALVEYNKTLKSNFYLLKISGKYKAKMGQFFMIKKDSQFMFLNRPMSVYDLENDGIIFLYKKIGKGTAILAECKSGDEINIYGPYGNGFPIEVKGNIALVGGGTGIAPLFYAIKQLKKYHKGYKIHTFLGLQAKSDFESSFGLYSDYLKVTYGQFITDYIQYEKYNTIFSCGPELMMKKIEKQASKLNIEHYVSLEKRMACGVGACLVCTCQTINGNKRVCKDGPVFRGKDVFW
jgi:dihydroorotate dehydrogenase electron transfer subunit